MELRGYPERGRGVAVNPCCDGICGELAANRHNLLRPKQFRHLTGGFPDSL
jgi:hypothetical protein